MHSRNLGRKRGTATVLLLPLLLVSFSSLCAHCDDRRCSRASARALEGVDFGALERSTSVVVVRNAGTTRDHAANIEAADRFREGVASSRKERRLVLCSLAY